MNSKTRSIVLNIIFLSAFLIHLTYIGYDMHYPKFVENLVYEKNLSDIQFPLAIKLCLIRRDFERYRKVGYHDDNHFYLGISKFSKNMIGWNGHTKNGNTIAPVKGKNSTYVT